LLELAYWLTAGYQRPVDALKPGPVSTVRRQNQRMGEAGDQAGGR
jgi:hypothetical protein